MSRFATLLSATEHEVPSQSIVLQEQNLLNKSLFRRRVVPTKWLRNFYRFLHHQSLVNVGGRIRNADIPQDQNHPILLSSLHHIFYQIAWEAHRFILHDSLFTVRNYLGMSFWILLLLDQKARRIQLYRCLFNVKYMSQRNQQKSTRTCLLPKFYQTQPFYRRIMRFA